MRNCRILLFALLAFAALAPLARAAEALPAAADPVLEKRVMDLSQQLRCLVCQNQTIADSHADLAIDLRRQVREQLQQGRSDEQVVDYMVQRYGDFVRYLPPFKAITWLLWAGPALLLAAGLLLLARQLHRRPAADDAGDGAVREAALARAALLLQPHSSIED